MLKDANGDRWAPTRITYKQPTEVLKMPEDSEWKKIETGSNFWNPEREGEELKGLVVEKTTGIYGDRWSIQTNKDTTIMTPSHKVLQARLQEVKIGDTIRIVYKGTMPPKIRGQNPTTLYEVYIKTSGGEIK